MSCCFGYELTHQSRLSIRPIRRRALLGRKVMLSSNLLLAAIGALRHDLQVTAIVIPRIAVLVVYVFTFHSFLAVHLDSKTTSFIPRRPVSNLLWLRVVVPVFFRIVSSHAKPLENV